MKCSYCDKDDASVIPVFTDTGCQVGMNYMCPECRKTKHQEYLNRTGFEEIGDTDDYDNFTGRPQHGAFNIFKRFDWIKKLVK